MLDRMVNRSLYQLTAGTYSNSQTFCREMNTSRTTAIICTRTNAPKCILGLHRLHFGSMYDQNGCNFKPWLELFFLKVIATISFLCAFIVIVVVWILLFFNIENGFLELYHYNYRPWCEWAFNLEIDRYVFFYSRCRCLEVRVSRWPICAADFF